jgi:DUF4097 and DUF4098 domain-containing protein YvlB
MALNAKGLVGLSVLALIPAVLAAQDQDDNRWLKDCEDNTYDSDSREQVCEVRHTGFRLNGNSLTVDPDRNGGAEIIGWDKDSVAVTTRIQANGHTLEAAQDLAKGVKTEISGSTIRVSGPSAGRKQGWGAQLVIWVPRKINLAAETVNGPLSVDGVAGTMNLKAQNGPVSLTGVGGDVVARVQNGPLSVKLSGTKWDGKGLDAESVNGPVDLAVPENYNAELETGTVNGPYDVAMPLTVTIQGSVKDRIHSTLGKGGAPVRVVTTNGPLTIRRARS